MSSSDHSRKSSNLDTPERPLERLLTETEVAYILGVKRRSIRTVRRHGLPYHRIAGQIRLHPDDVRKHIEATRIRTAPPAPSSTSRRRPKGPKKTTFTVLTASDLTGIANASDLNALANRLMRRRNAGQE